MHVRLCTTDNLLVFLKVQRKLMSGVPRALTTTFTEMWENLDRIPVWMWEHYPGPHPPGPHETSSDHFFRWYNTPGPEDDPRWNEYVSRRVLRTFGHYFDNRNYGTTKLWTVPTFIVRQFRRWIRRAIEVARLKPARIQWALGRQMLGKRRRT